MNFLFGLICFLVRWERSYFTQDGPAGPHDLHQIPTPMGAGGDCPRDTRQYTKTTRVVFFGPLRSTTPNCNSLECLLILHSFGCRWRVSSLGGAPRVTTCSFVTRTPGAICVALCGSAAVCCSAQTTWWHSPRGEECHHVSAATRVARTREKSSTQTL